MITKDSEQLIERYLAGTMTNGQEEEFFINVAIDNDLRRMLKSYQIVDGAIRKYRDVAPVDHSAARNQLLARLNLSETPPAVRMPAGAAPSRIATPNGWLTGGLSVAGMLLLLLLTSMPDSTPSGTAIIQAPTLRSSGSNSSSVALHDSPLLPDATTRSETATNSSEHERPEVNSAARPSARPAVTGRRPAATASTPEASTLREVQKASKPNAPLEPKPEQHAQKRIEQNTASSSAANDASEQRTVNPAINAKVDVDLQINSGAKARQADRPQE